MNKNQINERRKKLINLLNIYLSKEHIQMKSVMKGIKIRLLKEQKITNRQFNSITEYLKRDFKKLTPTQIYLYFQPLIKDPNDFNSMSTLDEFIQ